jgi:ABC-type Fe3+-siderophore transport system permease subunit
MERRKWIPFLGAALVAIVLAAIVSAAGSSDTVALVLAAIIGSAVVSASIPYALAVRDQRLAMSRNARNGSGGNFNEASADVRLTQDLLELAGQQTRSGATRVDLNVETSA